MIRKVFQIVFMTVVTYNAAAVPQSTQTLRADYDTNLKKLERIRTEKYRRLENGELNLDSVIAGSREVLFTYLTEKIFPAWYGTAWQFEGTTLKPGSGGIACGYFVSTTLKHAGFNISRTMGLQPAENIIKNICQPKNIKRFFNSRPVKKVVKWIREKGEGIYIVGLDIHVGYIIYKNDSITFCHSTYYNPPLCVVNQPVLERSPLTNSKYRILGKILDDEMILKWLRNEEIPIMYDYFER